MSIPDLTLVTAVYDLTKYHPGARPLEKSLEQVLPLMSVPCYLVIFGDAETIPKLKEMRGVYAPLTEFRELPIEKWWTFPFINRIKRNREIYWATRDERTCAENHALMCNKFDFVLQIIEDNPFKTRKFGWIDAAAKKICEDFDPAKLLFVLDHVTEKFHLQILNVVDKKYKAPEMKREYYQTYRWLMCGSFFTCGTAIGKAILNRLKILFIQTTAMGFGHADEMLYLEILDEFYDDIVRSYGDYGQILNNFIMITRNVEYIYTAIIMGYNKMNQLKELWQCTTHVLKCLDDHVCWVKPETYLEILFLNYIATFYQKREAASAVVERIRKMCRENPAINTAYLKNREFYDRQLVFAEKNK